MQVVGSIVYGKHGSIMVRQKTEAEIELGELLVVDQPPGDYSILQVHNLQYASQIPDKNLEMISGMKLEGFRAEMDFMEPALRNYVLAMVKSVLNVRGNKPYIPKTLPQFMSNVRPIQKSDLGFIETPSNPIYLGDVRSGSKVLPVGVYLDGVKVFTHHMLIPATTGRGKSNLIKVMLWGILDKNYCATLVLDPHDEYYGRHLKGLKDHPKARENLVYYSLKPIAGMTNSPMLVFNFKTIKPWHFTGIVEFSQAQREAMIVAYSEHKDDWLCKIMEGTEFKKGLVDERTVKVLQRRIGTILGLRLDEQKQVVCRTDAFSDTMGLNTVKDILNALEAGKKVIIDTSRFTDQLELLIGSIILHEVFDQYKKYKLEGDSDQKPVISVIVEEAPRVLSKDVLASSGDNIYSTIAKEGRKFNVGLTAITQLTSIIPQTILANMNTKIILGNELAAERNAIINSASQDLSSDDQNIASLDKGEAIISSNFTKFAIPIQIPLFEEYIKKDINNSKPKEKTHVVM